jgi:hypothetical protein
MSSTTSIHDLPTDPTGGGSIEGNINLVAGESNLDSDKNNSNPINLDQTTINQIINGLQQASSTGITNLPSRDIPMSSSSVTQDAQIQPNFIPSSTNDNYIEDGDNMNDMIYYNKQSNRQDSLDSLYNEIQIPLLLIVLYFIFQLPIFKTTVFKYLPFLCNKDGNMNLRGLIFTSILYGTVFYLLSKLINQFSQF